MWRDVVEARIYCGIHFAFADTVAAAGRVSRPRTGRSVTSCGLSTKDRGENANQPFPPDRRRGADQNKAERLRWGAAGEAATLGGSYQGN